MGICHSADAGMGGLVFDEVDLAYDLLLGASGGHARVQPGDPSCSLLMIRLEGQTSDFRMPPGPTPLLAAERCAIAKWIAAGAER